MKSQKFNFLSFFLFLFLTFFSLILFPFLILIDIFINLKREDKKRYFNERFNIFFIYKSIKSYLKYRSNQNFPFYISIATSAGEISTLEILFESTDVNLLIFTTSITGRNKKLSINNSTIFYLPMPNLIYCLILFFFFKPSATLFLEHEFWPSYFISSSLLNIPIITFQIRPNLFKSEIFSFFYLNLLRLSDLIFLTEKKEKYPKKFPFHKVKIDDVDIKITKTIKSEINNPKISITFASTHEEEEEIFFESIKLLKDRLIKEYENIDFIIFFAPRHPNRSEFIKEKAKEKNIKSVFYSDIKNEIKNLFDDIDKNFIIDEKYFNNRFLKFKRNIDSHFYSNEFSEKELKAINEKLPVIIVNEFGILDYIYRYSKVAIVGATFAELGGGHNIYEPLINGCCVIVGKYLHNMLNIFEQSEKLNIACKIKEDPVLLADKILHYCFVSSQFQDDRGIFKFSNSPFEKLYLCQLNFKQHILDKISKVSGNS